MGKIGKSVREELGLINTDEQKREAQLSKPAASVNEAGSRITAFGVKTTTDSEGKKSYECVMLTLQGDEVVSEELLSPTPRQRKALVLEDWRRQAGKFMLDRYNW